MENRNFNKALLIGEAMFTGIFLFLGIFFYIHASIIPKPEGTVLTSGFVVNYVNIKIYKDLGSFSSDEYTLPEYHFEQ